MTPCDAYIRHLESYYAAILHMDYKNTLALMYQLTYDIQD